MGLQALTNGLVWTFTGASMVMVALRLVSRLRFVRAPGWDDGVIVIALIVNISSACLASYSVSRGVGITFDVLPPDMRVSAAKWAAIADSFALMSFTVPKLSVAILITRILNVLLNSRLKRIALLSPAIISIAWSIADEGIWYGQCHPTAALWDKSIPDYHCIDGYYFLNQGIALCAFSATADLFYALFPILFITKLNMSRAKKIHLSLMFGLGIVCSGVAIWKTTRFIAIADPAADLSAASAHLIYATLIEANLLVVCACVPTVVPVVRAVRARLRPAPGKPLDLAAASGTAVAASRSAGHDADADAEKRASYTSSDGVAERILASIFGADWNAKVETGDGRLPKPEPRRGRRGFPAWRPTQSGAKGVRSQDTAAGIEEGEKMDLERRLSGREGVTSEWRVGGRGEGRDVGRDVGRDDGRYESREIDWKETSTHESPDGKPKRRSRIRSADAVDKKRHSQPHSHSHSQPAPWPSNETVGIRREVEISVTHERLEAGARDSGVASSGFSVQAVSEPRSELGFV